MITRTTAGEILLRRYAEDYISQTENLDAPVTSTLEVDRNFRIDGAGAHFPVRPDGDWSSHYIAENEGLPTPRNEHVIQGRAQPKIGAGVVQVTGLMEAIGTRNGAAFANVITDAIQTKIRRMHAYDESAFYRNGTGQLFSLSAAAAAATPAAGSMRITAANTGIGMVREQMIVQFFTTAGVLIGQATCTARNLTNNTADFQPDIAASLAAGTEVGFVSGTQPGGGTFREIEKVGLDLLVDSTGTYHNISRATFPTWGAQEIAAGAVSISEDLLQRLQDQIEVLAGTSTLGGLSILSNVGQRRKIIEVLKPFRRFEPTDLPGGYKTMTFNGNKWYTSYVANLGTIYMLDLSAVKRCTVRGLSIDPRVNLAWYPGFDMAVTLLKSYEEWVCRNPRATGKITGLVEPTF